MRSIPMSWITSSIRMELSNKNHHIWHLRNIYNLDPVKVKARITGDAGDKQIDDGYINDQSSAMCSYLTGRIQRNQRFRGTRLSWKVVCVIPMLLSDAGRHSPAAVGQTNFVTMMLLQMQDFEKI